METYEEYTRNRLEVKIYYDMDPESPREWDNVGTMLCAHRNYNLGDEQLDTSLYESWQEVEKMLKDERKAVIVLPLFLYDHSGITMYTTGDTRYRQHEAWDSGQVGFIYCTQEDIDREWDGDSDKAKEYLIGEVKTYDQYLTGDVYGFTITNPKNNEEIDSCWGFYGAEYAKEEANAVADNFVHPHDAAYAKNATIVHG